MTSFAVASAVIVVLMLGLSLLVATAQERAIATLRAHTADIKRWGGRILLAVGGWSITLGVFAESFARLFPV